MAVCVPHTIIGPCVLRQALPEPSRAKNDILLILSSSDNELSCASKSTKHAAKAAIEDADEAMPLLCGKVFWEVIANW